LFSIYFFKVCESLGSKGLGVSQDFDDVVIPGYCPKAAVGGFLFTPMNRGLLPKFFECGPGCALGKKV
jgi:hypothetical protein